MRRDIALQRYLQRHIEPALPNAPGGQARWQHVLVIPAYREAPSLLNTLRRLPSGGGRSLVILVLNRPETDTDPLANTALRTAAMRLSPSAAKDPRHGIQAPIAPLNACTDLYLYDMESAGKPTPAAQGVGLARKIGFDIALKWIDQGTVDSDWIYSTDADAQLPADYFRKVRNLTGATRAAVFPFRHVAGADTECNTATALYELRLHHYVLGLQYACSPYAYHSLGSCLAVKAVAYAEVRGFPRRAAGEDFYLLNKLAKVGPLAKLTGPCVELESRHSQRVPFGTGPATAAIARAESPTRLPLFYHPCGFMALRALLSSIGSLHMQPDRDLEVLLLEQGLTKELARASAVALHKMQFNKALVHCRRQGKSQEQYLRQFHQWFDAFRSLKFIHAIRDAGWPELSLDALTRVEPNLWPGQALDATRITSLRTEIARHWGWRP